MRTIYIEILRKCCSSLQSVHLYGNIVDNGF